MKALVRCSESMSATAANTRTELATLVRPATPASPPPVAVTLVSELFQNVSERSLSQLFKPMVGHRVAGTGRCGGQDAAARNALLGSARRTRTISSLADDMATESDVPSYHPFHAFVPNALKEAGGIRNNNSPGQP